VRRDRTPRPPPSEQGSRARLVIIRELGLGLAVAVFLDATLIRTVLLPATMRLLGEWNWYLPPFLRWLPHIWIEGEPVGELAVERVQSD